MTEVMVAKETWYEIEYSRRGADNWFSANVKADTDAAVKRTMMWQWLVEQSTDFDYRIVEKTLTTTVL